MEVPLVLLNAVSSTSSEHIQFSRLVDAAFTHKEDVRNIAIIAHHFYIFFLLRLPNLCINLSISFIVNFILENNAVIVTFSSLAQ